MTPVLTIIGRPNVGKSTLFNVLTRSRDALVADVPGLTRDRQYGYGQFEDYDFVVIDTGGIAETDDPTMAQLTDQQVMQAVEEADGILFVVDAHAGLTAADELIAKRLRVYGEKTLVVVNKSDHETEEVACSDFHQLGLGQPVAIAANRRRGIARLLALTLADFSPSSSDVSVANPMVAMVGRPNVGKSTLTNRLLKDERVIVSDQPGTTRDSIHIPFRCHGQDYTLIDTAGVRRRRRQADVIEKFSIVKTLQAINKAHVVIVVFNASEGISEQDCRLLGMVCQMGKASVLVINQWDKLNKEAREQVKRELDRKLQFANYIERYFISALRGSGMRNVYSAINQVYQSASTQLSTPQLTQALMRATHDHQPPLVRGRRIKLRYAHMGKQYPLTVIVHGKQVKSLPEAYQRYLSNYFRSHFKLVGVPLALHFRNDDNPYVG